MIYKFCSVKRVIAKVLEDSDIQEQNIRISAIMEWIGEGLLKIGGFPSLLIKTTGREDVPLVELVNYQAELPTDFHSLIQVSYCASVSGPFYPMRYATGSYEHNPVEAETSNTGVEDIISNSSLISLTMQLYNLTYEAALVKINTEPSTRSLLSTIVSNNSISSGDLTSTGDYIYTIRGGYIKTNQELGYLMIAYQAIPTDLEGYPLIPDNDSYIDALYWYVETKLLYPEWKVGRIRDAVYENARRSWNYYCKQAYGAAMMPDKGQQESIKNTWNRLIPTLDEFDTSFSNLGQQEVVYTQNG